MSVNMIDDQKCEIWACSARPVSLHSRDKPQSERTSQRQIKELKEGNKMECSLILLKWVLFF